MTGLPAGHLSREASRVGGGARGVALEDAQAVLDAQLDGPLDVVTFVKVQETQPEGT